MKTDCTDIYVIVLKLRLNYIKAVFDDQASIYKYNSQFLIILGIQLLIFFLSSSTHPEDG
jgi:hypothetical protein